MVIKEMERQDIPGLSTLYEQFWGEKSDVSAMSKAFDGIKNKNTHILLCAFENNVLVGSVMGIVCQELYGTCQPFLVVENMIVDKNFQCSGIGGALLHTLETKAKGYGCTQMILVTEKDRKDACSFYEACGFQQNNAGYKKKI